MVQVGNEIRAGMMWPEGRVGTEDADQWKRLSALTKAGVQGVKEGSGRHRILTMLHLDEGGDNGAYRWWFDHMKAEGVEFDTIGMSYYPFWHGPLTALQTNMNDVSRRYGKDVYVVETAYPFEWGKEPGPYVYNAGRTGESYPATPEGQAAFLRALRSAVSAVPDGRGRGILYWAQLWIRNRVGRSPWDNLAIFNQAGRALSAVAALGGR